MCSSEQKTAGEHDADGLRKWLDEHPHLRETAAYARVEQRLAAAQQTADGEKDLRTRA